MTTMLGVLRRPTGHTGVWGWLTTVDHKKIGIMYGISAFSFFLIGGVEALIMRMQLMQPGASFVSPERMSLVWGPT